MIDPQSANRGGNNPDEAPGDLSELSKIWRSYAERREPEGEANGGMVGAILDVVESGDKRESGAEPRSRGRIEEIAGRGEIGAAWDAVEGLHLALDRAVADGEIPSGDALALRRRLTRIQSRLHRAGLSTSLAARRELVRDITHDLRVPLNSIVFLTDSLFDEQHGELNEVQKRKLGGVYSASTTLLNFVNDLLDLSQSTEEDFECTSVAFSIRGVLEDAQHLVRPVADYYGADLEVDLRTEDSWRGDPRLVRRILLNLVTNALEAAGEGGEVDITVENGPDAHGTRRITVSDTGPGIDLERAEALLDPGEPARWRKLLNGTDGLGLLIIGRLVRAAGGSVVVERVDSGGGTRFVVDLPFGGDGRPAGQRDAADAAS